MTAEHPKIQALKKSLQSLREGTADSPKSVVTVDLPYSVQSSPKTYEKKIVAGKEKETGITCLIAVIEMTELPTSYTVKTKQRLTFDAFEEF